MPNFKKSKFIKNIQYVEIHEAIKVMLHIPKYSKNNNNNNNTFASNT